MLLTSILDPDCVLVPLKSPDKKQAITSLVQLLADNGKLKDHHAALQAVLDREAVRSTGVGQGFAIPHGKTPAVSELVMAVGKTDKPIDFDSIDGQPVNFIILLLSPIDRTGPHIQALARISRMMTEKKFRDRLAHISSPGELYHHIADHENRTSS